MMDTTIGRFTTKDPVMYLNLYRYVKNNPMRYNDYSGMGENKYGNMTCGEMDKEFDSLKKKDKQAHKDCAAAHESGDSSAAEAACGKAAKYDTELENLKKSYEDNGCGTITSPTENYVAACATIGTGFGLLGFFIGGGPWGAMAFGGITGTGSAIFILKSLFFITMFLIG